MRPVIIGIGGAQSGAGKTTIASLILKRLKGWGAIKYTKNSLYCSITDDLKILSEKGKDTKRLLDAGAEGKIKKGAEKILEMADVVIFDKKPPQGTPKDAKRFHRDDVEGVIDFIMGLIKKCEDNR